MLLWQRRCRLGSIQYQKEGMLRILGMSLKLGNY